MPASIRVKLDRNLGEGAHRFIPLIRQAAAVSELGSVVRLGRDLDTLEPVAVKVMELKKQGQFVFKREVAMLKQANMHAYHRNVPRLLGQMQTRVKGFIVLEYLPFPTLSSFVSDIGPLDFDCAGFVLYQIVDAISFLLRQGLAHRDLKSENMMINPDNLCIKLIDFSLSTEVITEDDCDDSYRGTPLYMAPEVFRRGTYHIFPAETWSAGILFWECLLGKHPFSNVSSGDELKMAQSCASDEMGAFHALDTRAVELLGALLSPLPADRPKLSAALASVTACLGTRKGAITSPVRCRRYSISKTQSTRTMEHVHASGPSDYESSGRTPWSHSTSVLESRSGALPAM